MNFFSDSSFSFKYLKVNMTIYIEHKSNFAITELFMKFW